MATSNSEEMNSEDAEDFIVANGTNDLICAFCFREKHSRNPAVGICKECKCYLCNECLTSHVKDVDERAHRVAYFYCAHKLLVNKKVRATSFCLDCGKFLCQKCVLDHPGFRAYRHHTFIGDSGTEVRAVIREQLEDRRLFTRNSKRSSQSRHTRRSDDEPIERKEAHGRKKSPDKRTTKSENVFSKNEKRRLQVNMDEVYARQRTLIKSTTGRTPKTGSQVPVKERLAPVRKKPKSVRMQEVVKPANLTGVYECKIENDEHSCRVISAIFLSNNSVVFADAANMKIKLTDSEFKVTSEIKMEPFPVALCHSHSQETEVYASAGNKLYRIDSVNGLQIVQTIETNTPVIEGLSTWVNGIAVVFRSAKSKFDKKGHWEVHLFSLEGEAKFEIIISSPFAVKLTTPVWYTATIDDGNKIIVSDTFNNRLICIDVMSWNVVYVLKGKDSDGAPRSLAVDADDNLLVTWYDEVHTISQTGTDLGTPVSRIDKNSIIAFNQASSQLLVFNGSEKSRDKFSVYRIE